MGLLTSWTGFSDPQLNADELAAALWSSASPDDSFDILNGGLDSANWDNSNTPIPTWALQSGSFAAGYYYGFDRRDIILAKQQTTSSPDYTIPTNDFGYGLIASMSHKIFIPFDAEAVIFGFQAWVKQDCTYFTGSDAVEDGDDIAESFVVTPYINGNRYTGLIRDVPHYTHSENDPDLTMYWNAGTTDTDLRKWEYRWRCISGTGLVCQGDTTVAGSTNPAVDKGVFTFDMYVHGNIQAPDQLPASVTIDSGGIYILALR